MFQILFCCSHGDGDPGPKQRAGQSSSSESPAEKGNGIRFVVKEEIEGYETDAEPSQESFLVLGQDDDQLPKELLDALTGSSAGETKQIKLYSEQIQKNYTVTLKVQRVYKEKAKS